MACILRSIDNFRPRLGGVAIVPESLLHSELDALARREISKDWVISEVCELGASTFRGARAHAVVVRISPGSATRGEPAKSPTSVSILHTSLVRGGLPVHEIRFGSSGVPFVHTTDLASVARSNGFTNVRRVKAYSRGLVRGWMVLVPRVGVPDSSLIGPLYAASDIQLSDCVMAICCDNREEAGAVRERILHNWPRFHKLYRGTGARYVTVSQLANFLSDVYICSGAIANNK
jgi:hypothetical protein